MVTMYEPYSESYLNIKISPNTEEIINQGINLIKQDKKNVFIFFKAFIYTWEKRHSFSHLKSWSSWMSTRKTHGRSCLVHDTIQGLDPCLRDNGSPSVLLLMWTVGEKTNFHKATGWTGIKPQLIRLKSRTVQPSLTQVFFKEFLNLKSFQSHYIKYIRLKPRLLPKLIFII